jgi:DeoR family transcriptional regulator of aga operon
MRAKEPSASKTDLRVTRILQILRETGSVSAERLCRDLGVSIHTIRRSLQEMDQQGLLRRTHGGAEALEPLLYEPFRADRSFQEQVHSFAEEKRRIAAAAAKLVQPGNLIALTAGTTTTETIRNLPRNTGLTVMTNTVNVAMELSNRKDVDVYVTGGHLRGDWFSLVGPSAIENISRVGIDVLFIGVNGISLERGLTCLNAAEADVNKAMIRQAKKKIVVTDHSKFNMDANWQICTVAEVDLVITDTGLSSSIGDRFRESGVHLQCV